MADGSWQRQRQPVSSCWHLDNMPDTRCPASILSWPVVEASRQRESAHRQKRRPSAGVQSGLLAASSAERGAGTGTLGTTHRALELALALADTDVGPVSWHAASRCSVGGSTLRQKQILRTVPCHADFLRQS